MRAGYLAVVVALRSVAPGLVVAVSRPLLSVRPVLHDVLSVRSAFPACVSFSGCSLFPVKQCKINIKGYIYLHSSFKKEHVIMAMSTSIQTVKN